MPTHNPYNYNLPVDESMFYGRGGDVQAISAQLLHTLGDSFALIGGRRIGKTSMLEALQRELERLNAQENSPFVILPLRVDIDGDINADSLEDVFQFFIETIPALLNAQVPAVSQQNSPASARALETCLNEMNKVAQKESGKLLRCILMLDECERVTEKPWVAQFYRGMRHVLGGTRSRYVLKVVMAGSSHFLTDVKDSSSPLRNILTEYPLTALDLPSTRALITQPTANSLPRVVVNRVASQSGGHPFLTQFIMKKLWDAGLENASVAQVDSIAADFDLERNDFQHWVDDIGADGIAVYRALCASKDPLHENQLRARISSPEKIVNVLNSLYYHGVVSRYAGGTYAITGHQFQNWFVGCYPGTPLPSGEESIQKTFEDLQRQIKGLPENQQKTLQPVIEQALAAAQKMQKGDSSPETQSQFEKSLRKLLPSIQGMAGDIAEVAVASLASPTAGIAMVIQKIAKKALDDSSKSGL